MENKEQIKVKIPTKEKKPIVKLSFENKMAKIAEQKKAQKEKEAEKRKALRKKEIALINAENKKQRKEKEKILIKAGLVCEKILGQDLKEEHIVKLEKFLMQQEKNGNFYSNTMN